MNDHHLTTPEVAIFLNQTENCISLKLIDRAPTGRRTINKQQISTAIDEPTAAKAVPSAALRVKVVSIANG